MCFTTSYFTINGIAVQNYFMTKIYIVFLPRISVNSMSFNGKVVNKEFYRILRTVTSNKPLCVTWIVFSASFDYLVLWCSLLYIRSNTFFCFWSCDVQLRIIIAVLVIIIIISIELLSVALFVANRNLLLLQHDHDCTDRLGFHCNCSHFNLQSRQADSILGTQGL